MKSIQEHLVRAVAVLFVVLPLTALAQNSDIEITITEDGGDPIWAGAAVPGNLTYVVEAENVGDTDLTGLQVSVNLTFPAGVTVDSVEPASNWSGTFPGTWNIGELAAPILSAKFAILTIELTVSDAAAPESSVFDQPRSSRRTAK